MMTKHSRPLRWPQQWRRATAWLVLLSFCVNLLTPTLVLARDALPVASNAGGNGPRGDELSTALMALERAVERMHRRLQGQWEFEWESSAYRGQPAPAAADRAVLRALEDELEAAVPRLESLQGQLQAHFAQTRKQLQDAALPPGILARHDDSVRSYETSYATLRSHLHAIKTAHSLDEFKSAVAAAHAFLRANPTQPARTPYDAARPLAFGPAPSTGAGAPITAKSERSALDRKSNAGAEKSAPTAADLAANEDVTLTAEIVAKAAELGKNPVAIYRFVRNEIEYLPTHGSIQGAAQTLRTRRGNAADQASLLIALLRAAEIPARYVHGTIELPMDQARNWLGGATNGDTVLEVLTAGGVPAIGVTSNGTYTKVRLEHVWVEAFVDFVPSRGARHRVGDTWIPLDPSVKTHSFPAPLMPDSFMPALQDIADQMAASGEEFADRKAFAQVEAAAAEQAIRDLAPQTFQAIRALPEGTDIFDLLGKAEIEPSAGEVLAPVLPHKVLAVAGRVSTLPAALRHQIRLELQAMPQYGGEPQTLFIWSGALPALEMKSLDLRYVPATADDAAAWESYEASGATSFPLYAIRAKAQLAVDGSPVATGPGLAMGAPVRLLAAIGLPGRTAEASFAMTAGDHTQVGINGAGYTKDAIHGLLKHEDDGSTVEDNLYLTARTHWIEEDLFGQLMAISQGVQFVRMPSVGVFARPLTVTYRFGLPHMGYYDSHRTDIQLSRLHASALNGEASKARTFVQSLGVMGSTLEGGVIEQLFRKGWGRGSNTARILELANQQGVPTYVLNPGDAGRLAELSHHPDVLRDVSNALAAGRQVMIPQREIRNGDWIGAGFIVRDPASGAGAYLIDGGFAGNSTTACERVTVPVPVKFPAVSRLSLLLLATSPLVLDDEAGEVNGLAVAGLALLAIVVVIGVVVAAPLEAAGAAIGAGVSFLFSRIAVAVGFGLAAGAVAAAGSDCSCAPAPACPHLGGHAGHNACADYKTDAIFRGCDVFVSGNFYDAYNVGDNLLWEIKTNNWPYEYRDGRLKETLNSVVLIKHLLEFQEDKQDATSCGYDYHFGVKNVLHMSALQILLIATGDSEDVVLHGCP